MLELHTLTGHFPALAPFSTFCEARVSTGRRYPVWQASRPATCSRLILVKYEPRPLDRQHRLTSGWGKPA
jgi:hypothetical protein